MKKNNILKLVVGGLILFNNLNVSAQNLDIHSDFSYGYCINNRDTIWFDGFIESENYNFDFMKDGRPINKPQANFHFFDSKDNNYFNWYNDNRLRNNR